ncbi:hypothetical protein ACU8KH_05231 [Lachancea thermotolerans]
MWPSFAQPAQSADALLATFLSVAVSSGTVVIATHVEAHNGAQRIPIRYNVLIVY